MLSENKYLLYNYLNRHKNINASCTTDLTSYLYLRTHLKCTEYTSTNSLLQNIRNSNILHNYSIYKFKHQKLFDYYQRICSTKHMKGVYYEYELFLSYEQKKLSELERIARNKNN